MRESPRTGTLRSVTTLGHTQASSVDSAREKAAAPPSSGEGRDCQKKPVVRLLNRVRKSLMDTCAAGPGGSRFGKILK